MQSVTIEGYLAADPSVLSAQGDGRKRAAFRVGETTRFKRADGSSGERTTWFNCVCFNAGTAENYIGRFAGKEAGWWCTATSRRTAGQAATGWSISTRS